MGTSNNNISDIARRAGVSTTTVYKAMHNLKGVSDARRAEILKIAQEMNYQGNPIARTLARKTIRIGVVFEALNPEFTFHALEGVKAIYEQFKHYNVEMIFCKTGGDVDKKRVLDNFASLLEQEVNGIILFPSIPYLEYAQFNSTIEERKLPVVTIVNDVPHLKCLVRVQYDGELLGRMAGDLMNLCNPGGSSAVIIGNKDVNAQERTIAGFKAVIEGRGGEVVAAYENQYIEDINRLVMDRLFKTSPSVNGIFVGVSQSVQVIDYLRERGLLPLLRVITVDTYPYLTQCLAAGDIIATLDRQPFQMGRIAVRAIYSYLNDARLPENRILLPGSVVLPSGVGYVQQPREPLLEIF
ncbi:MAG: LacI family transcriptional regulator [Synergistaceae bacterium]|jgi:LacI family transcriptional regulator|nr:LacI family transcriptional regulator [Synergistaceae bacterium]